MTMATATDMTARNPRSRKERRDLLKGVQRVTTDPNDLIQSDDEVVPPKMERNDGRSNDTYQNPPSLPSTIKVRKSSDSHQ